MKTRQKTAGPFQDAVYDLFVRRGMSVLQIRERFQGRVSLDEIRAAIALAARPAAP